MASGSIPNTPERSELHRQPVSLPMRQVHLDFHTSPDIPDVGKDFDPEEFARIIKEAHIDSVTVFAKCHHGLSYYPTEVGVMHPSLTFDLLGAQIEALHRVGVRAPIYISVGWDEYMADQHPEWRQVDVNGCFVGKKPFEVNGWRLMDLATPYADYVLAQTEEVLQRYGPVDGIFFDIVRQDLHGYCSAWRLRRMREDGVDITNPEEVAAWGLRLEREFMARAHELVKRYSPEATIYYNSRLRPDIDPVLGTRGEAQYYTHFEIESLPTGHWGYNHYPLFAAYFQTLGLPLLGMTGIFHTAWGDFGSLKSEAALQYECARMLASGAACSIGDQMHPRGKLDPAAYRRIGAVYARVEALEPWVRGTEPVPEIGVLMAETGPRSQVTGRDIDEGAMRMLLELHRLFQFVDAQGDFSRYRLLIVPDDVPFAPELAAKVQRYLEDGGALILTHRAGLTPEGDRFALDIGVEYVGPAPHTPDFLVPQNSFAAPETTYPLVLYERGSQVRLREGAEALAFVGYPYFTRSFDRYMSHRHTPYDRTSTDPAIVRFFGRVIYCHSPYFRAYRRSAVPAYRDIIGALIDLLVPERVVEVSNLPTTAEVSVLRQPQEGNRYVVHLIHAVPQRRGLDIDIVEDVLPLRDVRVGLRTDRQINSVTMVPKGHVLPHETADGVTWVTVPEVRGHQVLVFE